MTIKDVEGLFEELELRARVPDEDPSGLVSVSC